MNHSKSSKEPFRYVKHDLYWKATKCLVVLWLSVCTYEISLNCRSTDYGTTYEKLNDKVGLKTILSYLYVCPTNKRKVRDHVVGSFWLYDAISVLVISPNYLNVCYYLNGWKLSLSVSLPLKKYVALPKYKPACTTYTTYQCTFREYTLAKDGH